MLAEKRQEEILELLERNGSVTIQNLTEYFHASESTIRRDLNTLQKKNKLNKVFGGAISLRMAQTTKEEAVSSRQVLHVEEKRIVGAYAAAMIEPEDFVYLDAGTTTGAMLPYITEKSAVFVTNAVVHALDLASRGFRAILIGGELKSSTEAIVGSEAYGELAKYNFTKGFFGTNGVDLTAGFTTPDINEALVKKCALEHSGKKYVLATSEKFQLISPVRFADFDAAQILTDKDPGEHYKNCVNITICPKMPGEV